MKKIVQGQRTPRAGKSEIYRSQVMDRTFQLLDILGSDGGDLGITELAERLGLHKSTTHRLMMVLENNQYVEKDAVSGKYRLGRRIMQLGLSALSKLDIYEVAKPHLRALVAETGETAHVGIMRDCEVVSLVNVESTQTIRTPSTTGTRHPVHCSSLGKAILAFCTPEAIDQFLNGRDLAKYTRNTITSPAHFRRELESIRQCGYAIDDEEREEGLRCIGAPVRDSSGEVIGAVSIAGPVFRITRDRNTALAESVVRVAHQISASLGFHAPQLREEALA